VNRLIHAAALLLSPDERDAVLGDLEEMRPSAPCALAEVLGLAARRQAAQWRSPRPWLTLATLAIPMGMLLCLLARRTADGTAIDLWLYANNWVSGYLRQGAARLQMTDRLADVALQYLMLASWSWSAGLALGKAARGSLPLNALVFAALAFCGSLAGAPPKHFGLALYYTARAHNPNAAVFESGFYRLVFPHLLQAALVVAPAIFAMRTARRLPSAHRIAALLPLAAACAALAAMLVWCGLLPGVRLPARILQIATYIPIAWWLVRPFRWRQERST